MADTAAVAGPRTLRTVRPGAAALLLLAGACGPDVEAIRSSDLESARAVLLANIDAIRRRDVDAYLRDYLATSDLVTASPDGLVLGYESFEAARRASTEWPDTLRAGRPTLVWLSPGVVYAAYRYRATQGGVTSSGWSERVMVKTAAGWRIAVTSVIPAGR